MRRLHGLRAPSIRPALLEELGPKSIPSKKLSKYRARHALVRANGLESPLSCWMIISLEYPNRIGWAW
jgi:hypothetical protein